jgi:excisionase family DNA binding protein
MTGPVLRARDAAKYCGISYGTLRNLLHQGFGPRGYKNGSLNVFYPSDLDEWLRARLVPMASPSP